MKKIFIPLIILISLYSCKKTVVTPGPAPTVSAVYLSSFTPLGNFSPVYGDPFIATYFKGNQRQTIDSDSTKVNETTGIYVTGSDVYTSGSESFQLSSVAKYWKKRKVLSFGRSIQ